MGGVGFDTSLHTMTFFFAKIVKLFLTLLTFLRYIQEAYLEPSHKFRMELFANILNGLKPFTNFAKSFIFERV